MGHTEYEKFRQWINGSRAKANVSVFWRMSLASHIHFSHAKRSQPKNSFVRGEINGDGHVAMGCEQWKTKRQQILIEYFNDLWRWFCEHIRTRLALSVLCCCCCMCVVPVRCSHARFLCVRLQKIMPNNDVVHNIVDAEIYAREFLYIYFFAFSHRDDDNTEWCVVCDVSIRLCPNLWPCAYPNTHAHITVSGIFFISFQVLCMHFTSLVFASNTRHFFFFYSCDNNKCLINHMGEKLSETIFICFGAVQTT